jgi:hypothetical protein
LKISDSSYEGFNFHYNSFDGEIIKKNYFPFLFFAWFLDLVNESEFIGYIIRSQSHQKRKMKKILKATPIFSNSTSTMKATT